MNTYASLRDFQSFPLIPTFNMLVQKLSWIILLLFLSQHGIEAGVTCEGRIAVLSCGAFGIISVNRATYGRTDHRTCARGRPYSQISNTRCSVTVTNIVSHRCNGRKRCVVPASNSLLGDPCVGTYKYLHVTYRCRI
ncbi:L-rhamnose-binding lectin CSL3-like isoform X2 [Pimephales promelas]|uniref:L-rhamnose-binding lectin CSL3-like isoform X2 n=1 Tax=Pimephales promelas TaxID=90988 RepID=UPI0019555162|nr:L-rhamnose-binding lectin CSL3-like isoform X2 [Pimephales promelas]